MSAYQDENRVVFEGKLYRALMAFHLDEAVSVCLVALRVHCISVHEFFEYLWFLEKFFV